MRKLILMAAITAVCSSISMAQDKKPEFSAEFTVNSLDTGLGNFTSTTTNGTTSSTTTTFNNNNNRLATYGFDVNGTGYVTDRVGIEGDFSANFRTTSFSVTQTTTPTGAGTVTTATFNPFQTRFSIYQFGAGPHVRFPTSNAAVTPFLHAIFGAAVSRVTFPNAGTNFGNSSSTNFAMKLGGGVDFGRRTAVRLQLDYAPIFSRSLNFTGTGTTTSTANNVIFGVGVRFK